VETLLENVLAQSIRALGAMHVEIGGRDFEGGSYCWVDFESLAQQAARKGKPALVFGYLYAIGTVYKCRRAIAASDIWTLAWHMSILRQGWQRYFQDIGEKSWRRGKTGGRPSLSDRDKSLALEYEAELAAGALSPTAKRRISKRHEIKPPALAKAIDRGLKKLGKKPGKFRN